MMAIDADKLLRDIEEYHVSDGKFQHWVQIQPTIEPETCKDAVSRADVLECFADLYDTFEDCSKGIINELHRKFEDLRTLPSVTLKAEQPEIIYCKDCKHYKAYEYTGELACHYVIGGTVVRKPDDFCSRAERITDD